jgi:outer membrane lipoprotein carrier protein
MKAPIYYLLLLGVCLLASSTLQPIRPAHASEQLETILQGIEKRYKAADFTARFDQTSTVKAMNISDTARGKIMVKKPNMMRWEYEAPEPQTIITDGIQLWVYRKVDNQVMIGKAPRFFGRGKGAGFLSDIRTLRDQFDIAEETPPNEQVFRLKLLPKEATDDIALIYLTVSRATFEVMQVVTLNAYEDETRIVISGYAFGVGLTDDLFRFEAPEGTDILHMDD